MKYEKPTIHSSVAATRLIQDGTDGLGHQKRIQFMPDSTTHLTINSTTGAYEIDE